MKRILLALVLLCAAAIPAQAQYLNPSAQTGIHNSSASMIPRGTAVVATGSVTGFLVNVNPVSSTDSRPTGIVQEDIAASSDGAMYQTGLSPVQVLLASAVSAGDSLRVTATGRFEAAPYGSQNGLYQAFSGGAGGAIIWALPVASRPIIIANPATGTATGSTSGPTKNDSTPSVIPEMTVSMTTSGGRVICDFNGAFSFGLGFSGFAAIFLDGTEVAGSRRPLSNSLTILGLSGAFSLPIPLRAWGNPAAGAHTITVQWAATAGTITAVSTQRSLVCEERML